MRRARAVLVLVASLCPAARADEHGHEHGSDAAPFTVADFARFGVRIATAGPGLVDSGVELPGEVRPNAERTAHIAAQFPGSGARGAQADRRHGARRRDAGDRRDDTLAPYPLTAAFDGVVLDQHATPGETVGPGAPAFVVADLGTVWVEINVYQKDLAAVRTGERVQVLAGHGIGDAEGTVSYVSPVLDQATRTAIARVVLPNTSPAPGGPDCS